MGYQLEPGTTLVGSIYLTHRREDLYPNPLEFRPERFFRKAILPLRIFTLRWRSPSLHWASISPARDEISISRNSARLQLSLSR